MSLKLPQKPLPPKQQTELHPYNLYPDKLLQTDLQLKTVQQKLINMMKGISSKKLSVNDRCQNHQSFGKFNFVNKSICQDNYQHPLNQIITHNKINTSQQLQSNPIELTKIQKKKSQKIQITTNADNNNKNCPSCLTVTPSNMVSLLKQWANQDQIDQISKKQIQSTISFYQSKLAQRQNLYLQLKQLCPKSPKTTKKMDIHQQIKKSQQFRLSLKQGEVNEIVPHSKQKENNKNQGLQHSQIKNEEHKQNINDNKLQDKNIPQQNCEIKNGNTLKKEEMPHNVEELQHKISTLQQQNQQLKLKNESLSHQCLQLEKKQSAIDELSNKIKQLQQKLKQSTNINKQKENELIKLQQTLQQKQKQLLQFTNKSQEKTDKQPIKLDIQSTSTITISKLTDSVGQLFKKLKYLQNVISTQPTSDTKVSNNSKNKDKNNVIQSKYSPINLLKQSSAGSSSSQPQDEYRLTGFPGAFQMQQDANKTPKMKKQQVAKNPLPQDTQSNKQELNQQIYQISEQLIHLCKCAMSNSQAQMKKKQSAKTTSDIANPKITEIVNKGSQKGQQVIKQKGKDLNQTIKSLGKITNKYNPYEQKKQKQTVQGKQKYQKRQLTNYQNAEDCQNNSNAFQTINNQVCHMLEIYFKDSKISSDSEQSKQVSIQTPQKFKSSPTSSQISSKCQNQKPILLNLKKLQDLHQQFSHNLKSLRLKNKQQIERIYEIIKSMITNFSISYNSMDSIIIQNEKANNSKQNYLNIRQFLNTLYKRSQQKQTTQNKIAKIQSIKSATQKSKQNTPSTLYENPQNKLQKLNTQPNTLSKQLNSKTKQAQKLTTEKRKSISNANTDTTTTQLTELKTELAKYKKKCSDYETQIQGVKEGAKKKSERIIYIRK